MKKRKSARVSVFLDKQSYEKIYETYSDIAYETALRPSASDMLKAFIEAADAELAKKMFYNSLIEKINNKKSSNNDIKKKVVKK